MFSKRAGYSKPLSLSGIIDQLELLDKDSTFPRSVTILPPDNATADITDEDSGDEEFVPLNNLPGSQLRAPAEIEYRSSDSEDDLIPLSALAKRRRTAEAPLTEGGIQVETSISGSVAPMSNTSHIPFVEPTVSKNQKYTWRNIHNPRGLPQWQQNQGPKPIYNIGLYRTTICGKKWYFLLLCHCLDMAINNSWQRYKENGEEYDNLNFRRSVARGMLETYKKYEKRGPCPTPASHRETSRYDRIDHIVEYKLSTSITLC